MQSNILQFTKTRIVQKTVSKYLIGGYKMKVLLVSPLPPPIGGIATWTENYINFFKMTTTDIYLVNSAIRGKRVTNVSKKSYLDEIKRIRDIKIQIKNQLTHNQIDIIHYNASCSFWGLIKDYVILKNIDTAIFYQCHCDLNRALNNRMSAFIFSLICEKAKCIGVLNKSSYDKAKIYTERVKLVPNFISGEIKNIEVYNEEIKKVCYVGRIVKDKGIYELLSAAKKLSDINFLIVGPEDEKINEELLSDNVTMVGPKSNSEVMKILRDSDIYILPSYTEGFPLGVLEAMSCGLPIIATDVGSISDMIEDKGGILISPKSVSDIIEAIRHMREKQVRTDMGKFNFEKVKNEYVIDVVLQKTIVLYHEIIKDKN